MISERKKYFEASNFLFPVKRRATRKPATRNRIEYLLRKPIPVIIPIDIHNRGFPLLTILKMFQVASSHISSSAALGVKSVSTMRKPGARRND
jgi:hypothetical protein